MRPFIALVVFDERYRKLAFRAALLLYGAVLVLGSIPGAREEAGELASGLILHALTYSVITLLLFCGTRGSASNKALKSILIVAAMGALDEFVQSFFPYRSANVMDWFVDVNASVLTSVLLWKIWPVGEDGHKGAGQES